MGCWGIKAAAAAALLASVAAWAGGYSRELELQAEAAVSLRRWDLARPLYKRSLREAVRESDVSAISRLRNQIARLPVESAVIERHIADERYDEAFKHLKAYVNYNPGDVWAMSLMGSLYERIGQDRQAERLYRKAVRLQPEHPTPRYYYGRYLLLKKKKFDAALQELERFRANLGQAKAKASESERRALERERIQATRWIASVRDTVLKEPARAMGELEPLIRVEKPDPEVLYEYGLLAMRNGRKRTAYDALVRVQRLSPGTALEQAAAQAIELMRNTDSSGYRYADPYS